MNPYITLPNDVFAEVSNPNAFYMSIKPGASNPVVGKARKDTDQCIILAEALRPFSVEQEDQDKMFKEWDLMKISEIETPYNFINTVLETDSGRIVKCSCCCGTPLNYLFPIKNRLKNDGLYVFIGSSCISHFGELMVSQFNAFETVLSRKVHCAVCDGTIQSRIVARDPDVKVHLKCEEKYEKLRAAERAAISAERAVIFAAEWIATQEAQREAAKKAKKAAIDKERYEISKYECEDHSECEEKSGCKCHSCLNGDSYAVNDSDEDIDSDIEIDPVKVEVDLILKKEVRFGMYFGRSMKKLYADKRYVSWILGQKNFGMKSVIEDLKFLDQYIN